VFIGMASVGSLQSNSNQNVMIGQGCIMNGASATGNTGVGSGCSVGGGSNSTVLGANANNNGNFQNAIILGASALATAVASDGVFMVETVNGGVNRWSMLFGNMNSGALVVGKSSDAQRDINTVGGTNWLKIINGTKGGGGNPNGGGYFYASAGALHWVGSSGTDTTIAPA
jgi:hypothetical protein